MFVSLCRTFPNNYWDKFVKRKVRVFCLFLSATFLQLYIEVQRSPQDLYVMSRFWINMGTFMAERELRSCLVWTWLLSMSAP